MTERHPRQPVLGHYCFVHATPLQTYEPQAEDILCDENLLDLFRIIKQILRKKHDSERLARLFFCIFYALGDNVKVHKPVHDNKIIFDDHNSGVHAVRLPATASCCGSIPSATGRHDALKWQDAGSLSSNSSTTSSASPITKLHPVPCIAQQRPSIEDVRSPLSSSDDTSTDAFTLRPYTNFKPLYPSDAAPVPPIPRRFDHPAKYTQLGSPIDLHEAADHTKEYVMEPKQRGFYYQDGRISREPVLLQRYAEHGILTQASLMRKRKRQLADQPSDSISPSPVIAKKTKIPHRHGEFEQRRDDIIGRVRSITITDLEQKAERLPQNYSLAIEQVPAPTGEASPERAAALLEPSLRILTEHSNMKPHLDNGMNQNGIYYNTDYYRLYLAFEQFQTAFATLFPNEVVKMHPWGDDDLIYSADRDRDRDRNANMKAYRSYIEPLLTETNWAAFRRNIVVGERMMQLTKIIGQGVLMMTKELSGSKLHLTFTNNEWDEFVTGLSSGRWDQTIHWDVMPPVRNNNSVSLLVSELRQKFATPYWFHPGGLLVSSDDRRVAITSDQRK